jgi:hypothetical protein
MVVYISLFGAVVLVLLAIVLWALFGPLGLLLLILAAVLFYHSFGSGPVVKIGS